MNLLLVEDNDPLRLAMKRGLEESGKVQVIHHCASGEDALAFCQAAVAAPQAPVGSPQAPVGSPQAPVGSPQAPVGSPQALRPDVILMDVRLAGALNGIQAAVAIRRELPRLPVVFYSIQDDDAYYRDFRKAGILSHYAYVRKSNYLLPALIVPLLQDAMAGRSLIDPEIESRVHEVRVKDDHDPMALLEPNEQVVARLLAQGLTNEQIAQRLGFADKRTISRTNGQIYAAWGLDANGTDEKVARTRAAIIVRSGQLISWDAAGRAQVRDVNGDWKAWSAT